VNGLLDQYQGMTPGGLLMSGAPNSIQPLLGGSVISPPSGNPLTLPMGPWAQMAYRMAGSPIQGPSPSVPVPPTTAPGGSSAGIIGGLLGLLGGASGSRSSNSPSLTQDISLGQKLYGALNPTPATSTVSPAVDQQISQGVNNGPYGQAPQSSQQQTNYSASNTAGDVAAPIAASAAPAVATSATPTGVISIYDEAGNLVSGGAAGAGTSAAGAGAADTGATASGSSAGLGAAGTAALAAALFAGQRAMYDNDPVGSPHSQAWGLLDSMQYNPFASGPLANPGSAQAWQDTTAAMQQWIQQHGDLNGFWASLGANTDIPGGSAQPQHQNVQS